MTVRGKRRAGQPILVFAALLIGWAGLRVAVWESPFPAFVSTDLVEAVTGRQPQPKPLAQAEPVTEQAATVWPYEDNGFIPPPQPVTVNALPLAQMNYAGPDTGLDIGLGPQQSDMFASHQLLWLAAMGRVPVPREVADVLNGAASNGAAAFNQRADKPASRWSADGWVYLRPDAQLGAATGPRFASYGASQAGAVLRYQLKPGNAARPAAYVRATKALAAGRETEIAAGLSARPVPAIPIAAYAEMRVTRGAVTTEVRPAVFAVTQFPPVQLPLGLRGETYLAGGYVGGDFATPFVDGQARIDREIVQFDLGNVRAGAGAWGGAQRGAARIDVGPSASIDMKIGGVPARLSMDYRLRAAGDAQPDSGLAITFSTGF